MKLVLKVGVKISDKISYVLTRERGDLVKREFFVTREMLFDYVR